MKFMIEFRLKDGARDKVVATFEEIGPNRFEGVSFRGAWVGTRSNLIFALADSTNEAAIEKACQAWKEYGELTVHPVIDHDQF